ncbi:hypothetical protein JE959_000110 [Aeromonas veronii]|nr:hypothetical protein [Aeromonas veronii]
MAKPIADLFLTMTAFNAGIKFAVVSTSGVARSVDVKLKDNRLCLTTVVDGSARELVAKNIIDAKRLLDKSVSKMFSDGEMLGYQVSKGHKNIIKLAPSMKCGYEVVCIKGGEHTDRAERDGLNGALLFLIDSISRVFVDDHNKAQKDGEALFDMTKLSKSKVKGHINNPMQEMAAA